MIEQKPKDIDVLLDRLWVEIYGTNGNGILRKLDKLEEYMKMLDDTIDKYISIEKDFKIKYLEERELQKKERFWKIIGTISSLSGWAAFIISLIVTLNV